MKGKRKCVHYWLCQTISGGNEVKQTCKLCGKEEKIKVATQFEMETGNWRKGNVYKKRNTINRGQKQSS